MTDRIAVFLRWRHTPLALTLVAYAAAILMLRPFHDVYYGGDDWVYAWSAEHLVETGQLRASSWAVAAAVPQTYWGALFVSVLGFHPWVLNLATLVASFIGAAVLYFAGLALRLRETTSGWLSLFIVAGPLYLGFAASFMSDMYYFVLALSAVLSTLHALRSGSPWSAALAGVLSSLAFLNRQVGFALPLGYGVALATGLWLRRWNFAQFLRAGLGGCLIPLFVVVAYQLLPDAFGGRTTTQAAKLTKDVLWRRFLDFGSTAHNGYLAALYAVVLVLPLLVVVAYAERSRILALLRSRSWLRPWIALTAVSLGGFAYQYAVKGSFAVRGEFFQTKVNGAAPLPLLDPLWTVLALLGSLAFPVIVIVLLDYVWRAFNARPSHESVDRVLAAVFLFVCLVLHWGIVAVFISYYSNYFLPLVPLTALLVCPAFVPADEPAAVSAAPSKPRGARMLRFALAGVSIAGSVVVLDHHFRYVEADRRVADALVARGFDSKEIFGYPSWYAERHYDIVDAIVIANPKGVFRRVSERCPIQIRNAKAGLPRDQWRLESSSTYSTLLGQRRINVWVRKSDRSG